MKIFCNNFVIHTLPSFLITWVQTEQQQKKKTYLKKIIKKMYKKTNTRKKKAKRHRLYVSVCTRLRVLYDG